MGNKITAQTVLIPYKHYAETLEDLNKDILNLNRQLEKQFYLKIFLNTGIEEFELFDSDIEMIVYKMYPENVQEWKAIGFEEFYQLYDNILLESSIHNFIEYVPEECSICLERGVDLSLKCGHFFCESCINKWKRTEPTCPVCREVFLDSESWYDARPLSRKDVLDIVIKFIEDL